MPKHLMDIENEKCTLEVYQCDCGCHIGVDHTLLDQLGDRFIECPACEKKFWTGTEI